MSSYHCICGDKILFVGQTDKTDQQASRIRKLIRDHRNDSFRTEKKEREESSSKQTSENAELVTCINANDLAH